MLNGKRNRQFQFPQFCAAESWHAQETNYGYGRLGVRKMRCTHLLVTLSQVI